MTVTRLFPSGAWQVSAIVGGYLKVRTFYGYSKREAMREFRRELRETR